MSNKILEDFIIDLTGVKTIVHLEDIQTLWSGYGKIIRYGLKNTYSDTIVVKHVNIPAKANHPRGWNTDLSHQRKLKSYQVEMNWYRNWSHHCDERCRVANCLGAETHDNNFMMVLEDLDSSGFSRRFESVSVAQMNLCLKWLANFHAIFMGQSPDGLWKEGTYWHLETRPDELSALNDLALKNAAPAVDAALRDSPYQTFVHGDAKLANFCFSEKGEKVAAVDFQYVGGGCGMKDVAYFIGSCLRERDCELYEGRLLDYYFSQLREALQFYNQELDYDDLERDWRYLYALAWTDFHRFMKGWSPGHWKIHGYSERLAQRVIEDLDTTKGAECD